MRTALAILVLTATVVASAVDGSTSPYAEEVTRQIKALSPEDTADLLAGRGMGYAKAAELNGYPGPSHVLQIADALRLSGEQRLETQRIFDRMISSAKAVGAQLVAAEGALDSLFRNRRVTPESLTLALDQIAGLQSKLRNIHLQAHLEQTALLTPHQVSRYVELRGYHQGPSESTKPEHVHK